MQTLLGMAIRASVMYVVALFLARLSGKRSLGKISPLDFVIVTVIGDLFDNIFWGTVPMAVGLTGFVTLFLLHIFTSYLGWKFPALERVISSSPTRVIQNGKWQTHGLDAERTSKEEVLSELRCQQNDEIEDIKAAQWEPSGQLSIIKYAEAQPAKKRDLR
jgi:uncharacterized membrane protein YcaP (DUF421 family)